MLRVVSQDGTGPVHWRLDQRNLMTHAEAHQEAWPWTAGNAVVERPQPEIPARTTAFASPLQQPLKPKLQESLP